MPRRPLRLVQQIKEQAGDIFPINQDVRALSHQSILFAEPYEFVYLVGVGYSGKPDRQFTLNGRCRFVEDPGVRLDKNPVRTRHLMADATQRARVVNTRSDGPELNDR